MWNLSNAFTSAFKELDAIPQFRDTARLGRFLEMTRPACPQQHDVQLDGTELNFGVRSVLVPYRFKLWM
jgi:hypothetical protein